MKGMVFTEYIEFVEDTFGFEVAQDMIEQAKLPGDGAYTGVGTYDSTELVNMVSQLAKLTKTPVPDLLIAYGKHLFGRFATLYPHFFPEGINFFDFIGQIDSYIHVEVQKLYPDAELPSVATVNKGTEYIEIIYTSKRKFGDFAHGLLLGAASFFNENVEITKSRMLPDGSKVRFNIQHVK